MGFYGNGNIVNSNRTSFSFDVVYPSRAAMDAAVATDGVFLGRYVLVEYDQSPIRIYIKEVDGQKVAFTDSHYATEIKLNTLKTEALYQDYVTGIFYKWKDGQWVEDDKSPYVTNYNTDVRAYGRGYDSTAWMKRYEDNNGEGGAYRYVLVAELNTITPNFHLLLEPPTEAVDAPYFDKDSTNVDYYLVMKNQYNNIFKAADENTPSDVSLAQSIPIWTYDEAKDIESYTLPEPQAAPVGIYFNKAGFDPVTRQYIDNIEDKIGFDLIASGRRYSAGVGKPKGQKNAEDTKAWYIRLPSIGNTLCEMWDKIYGTERIQTLSSERGDTGALYDQGTVIGVINQMRDVLGYTFVEKTAGTSATITNADAEELGLLYYVPDAKGVPATYYYYAYSPTFEQNNAGTYCLVDGVYKIANLNVVPENERYIKSDRWELVEIPELKEDSLYGLFITLHRIIGTGAAQSRELDTLFGCMNRIKDMIANIDANLSPNKILVTDENGVITTSNTTFPIESTKVLTGAGNWENRIKTINISGTSEEAAKDETDGSESVKTITDTDDISINSGNKWIKFDVNSDKNITAYHALSAAGEQTIASEGTGSITEETVDSTLEIPSVTIDNAGHIIEVNSKTYSIPNTYRSIATVNSDSDGDANAADLTSTANSINDTFNINTQNKWIKINATNDTTAIGHAHSGVTAQAYGQADNSTLEIGKNTEGVDDQKNYTFIVPQYTVDAAGHITESSDKTITLTHGASGVTAGSYGLADNETVTKLDADNKFEVPYYTVNETGHITASSTHTVSVPENFTTIKSTYSVEETGALERTGSNLEIRARNLEDSISFIPGNKWINIAFSNDKDDPNRIFIAHSIQDNVHYASYGPSEDRNLKFGSAFVVPHYTVDTAGHLTAAGQYNITLPTGSLETQGEENGNVISNMGYASAEGKITIAKSHAGDLSLGTYRYSDTEGKSLEITTASTIANSFAAVEEAFVDLNDNVTEEYNTLSKLETKIKDNATAINAEISNREEAITDAVNALKGENLSTEYDSLKKIEDKLKDHISNVNNPHAVTAEQLGVGAFKDQSIAGLFTNESFAPAVQAQFSEVAFKNAVSTEVFNLLNNFNLSLKPLELEYVLNGNNQVNITKDPNVSDAEVTITWKKDNDIIPNVADPYSFTITDATQNGTYTYTVRRTYNGYTSEYVSSPIELTHGGE